jgi:hypothetical protein
MVTHAELLVLAKDPTLVKGIYTVCDQWCTYCSATSHCLAYRCNPSAAHTKEAGAGSDTDEAPEVFFERLMTEKCLADAEGRLAPAEIETMLSGDRERQKRMFALRDPLERLGRHYMMTATAYLSTHAGAPPHPSSSLAGPTPFEVFVWFHALVPARIFRALVSEVEAREGVPGRREDTLATAKMALIGIDRSLEAVTTLAAEGDDPRLELLASLLRRLGPGVERRFAGARAYIRPGLDVVAGRGSSPSLLQRLRSAGSRTTDSLFGGRSSP